MVKEIELKFYPVDKDEIRGRLSAAGFRLDAPEFMMTRATFDAPPHLGKSWGRVRTEKDRVTMSIKCVDSLCLTGTSEWQVVVNSFDAAVGFMSAAGFRKKAIQENTREIWIRESVEATIDTWPGLDPYIEIESEASDEDIAVAAVYKAVSDLGFNKDDAMFGSSDLVYEKILGIPSHDICSLPEITFDNPPVKK
ncbi:MAG: CYTH domain-containing protein [Alphaproteobacteria bacterium]|nr:CYTH domain-containing protein [Alphaproteobacteria bacterium]